jgi:hypothetical protein
VKGSWKAVWCVLLVVMLLSSITVVSIGSSLYGNRFRLGQTIQFKVQDSTTWFWGCCSCEVTSVLGWRIVNSAEQVVYSVIHDAAVAASAWQGSWAQADAGAISVPGGQYKLYVDTSVGTLSRCFTIYDPCARNWCNPCARSWCSGCSQCVCEGVSSITTCACRTTLAFVDSCQTGCVSFPFFWGWGCGCSSSCP